MANSNNANINLSSNYTNVIPQSRSSIMQFPNSHSQDLSPHEAMAAALAVTHSNPIANHTLPDPQFNPEEVTKQAINSVALRLPTSDQLSLQHQVQVSNHISSNRLPHQLQFPVNHHLSQNAINSLTYPTIHHSANQISHTTPLPPPHNPHQMIQPITQSTILATSHQNIQTTIPTTHQDSLPPVSNIDTTPRTTIPQIALTSTMPQIEQKDDSKNDQVAGPSGGIQKKPTRRRRSRTGPATFICQLVGCGKAFRMQGDLQTHMRKHTGEEPFACSFPDCGMRYKWRSSLSHHEGLHKKSKDFKLKRKPRRPRSTTQPQLQQQQLLPPPQLQSSTSTIQDDKKQDGGT